MKRRKSEKFMINEQDFVELSVKDDMPFLKCVELGPKQTPQNFGLEKWTPGFTIPDNWMKKIYKKEVYRDTDLPEHEPEKFTKHQRTVLSRYLLEKVYAKSKGLKGARNTRSQAVEDDLMKELDKHNADLAETCDFPRKLSNLELNARRKNSRGALEELNSDNITVCSRHKIKTEDKIVKIALQKMRDLSQAEEKKYQQLLRDRDFMSLLNQQVEQYILNLSNDSGSTEIASSM